MPADGFVTGLNQKGLTLLIFCLPDSQGVLHDKADNRNAYPTAHADKIGLPPLFTSLTILVLRPMAAIAITMKNLLRVFNGINTSFGMPADTHMVVMMEAATKKYKKREKSL